MNKEDYVSLECAKLLKEKGFDEGCYAYYHLYESKVVNASEYDCFEYVGDGAFSFRNSLNRYRMAAPTLYEAQKWLREKYDINIIILCYHKTNYRFVLETINENTVKAVSFGNSHYNSYESTLNAGITEALKLI